MSKNLTNVLSQLNPQALKNLDLNALGINQQQLQALGINTNALTNVQNELQKIGINMNSQDTNLTQEFSATEKAKVIFEKYKQVSDEYDREFAIFKQNKTNPEMGILMQKFEESNKRQEEAYAMIAKLASVITAQQDQINALGTDKKQDVKEPKATKEQTQIIEAS